MTIDLTHLTANRAYVAILRETAHYPKVRIAIQGALVDLRTLATDERIAAELISYLDPRSPMQQTQDDAEALAQVR